MPIFLEYINRWESSPDDALLVQKLEKAHDDLHKAVYSLARKLSSERRFVAAKKALKTCKHIIKARVTNYEYLTIIKE